MILRVQTFDFECFVNEDAGAGSDCENNDPNFFEDWQDIIDESMWCIQKDIVEKLKEKEDIYGVKLTLLENNVPVKNVDEEKSMFINNQTNYSIKIVCDDDFDIHTIFEKPLLSVQDDFYYFADDEDFSPEDDYEDDEEVRGYYCVNIFVDEK